MVQGGETGQQLRIGPVGLVPSQTRGAKGADLGRVDHRHRQFGQQQRRQQRLVIAPGRLQHDQGRGGRAQRRHHARDAVRGVGRPPRQRRDGLAGGQVAGLRSDINADKHAGLLLRTDLWQTGAHLPVERRAPALWNRPSQTSTLSGGDAAPGAPRSLRRAWCPGGWDGGLAPPRSYKRGWG
jgi:hypothetical protein